MARYRLVHVGTAALLAAATVTMVGVAQSVIADQASASSFVPIVPCRLMDTRTTSPVGDRVTPFGPAEAAMVAVWGEHGRCNIPSTATAIVANLTATNPSAASHLSVSPSDTKGLGRSSSLNWRASSPPVANQVTVGLSTFGAIDIFNYAGTVDLIIDVSGYYELATAGPQGPMGEQGQQGPKGEPGPQGDPGYAGGVTETVVWTGSVTGFTDTLSDVVIPAGSKLQSVSATATFTNVPPDCPSADLSIDTEPYTSYFAGFMMVDTTTPGLSANAYIGQANSVNTQDLRLRARIGTCWDSMFTGGPDPEFPNPVPAFDLTATFSITLTWTHPPREIS